MRFPNCAVFFLLALTASAQSGRGIISGSVTDADGAAVANAQIQAKNEKGGQFQAKSSPTGAYSIASLPAGTYEIVVISPGLMPFQKPDVKLADGQTARVDARLSDFLSLGTVGEDRAFYSDILDPHQAPTGPAPRTRNGKPDFSGVWHALRYADPGKPEPLPWADALTKQRNADNLKDFPGSRCLPMGNTVAAFALAFRIMQNDSVIAFLYEDDLPRQIYLDGRKHPEESLSPFIGHSVGHWEGETLVVDTVGFNDNSWLDLAGHPHTDKMRTTERIRRKDLGHLEIETTIDDPGAYKKPWTIKRVTELETPDYEVGQYACMENNRDIPHLVGK